MERMKLKLLIVCIVVCGLVGLMASPAAAVTIVSQSANTDIFLGLPFNDLEFENPLTGTEMVKEYAVLEWRDADFAWGPPRWYDDWTVSDPTNIDGNADQIWMRQRDQWISTTTTVASTTVSIHLVGDNNDGLAEVFVDGSPVARLDMYTPSPPAQTALIIVKNLANTPHTITVKDLGLSPNGPLGADDVATMGAAALAKAKWAQLPERTIPDNLYYGWNEISDYNGHQIVADDWPCKTDDPVTDIHWWASFKGWTETYPPVMPSSFHITIWTDVPANPDDLYSFSHPNEVVWEVDCTNFYYDFVGWDYDPRTKCYEACFYFTQYLNPWEFFYQEPGPSGTDPTIYWISIAAKYPAGTTVTHPWGWKARPNYFQDDAVLIVKPTDPHIGDNYEDGKPIYWPDPNHSWDMAFELTTQPLFEVVKYEQLPDVYEMGIDVDATNDPSAAQMWPPQLIADDFPCEQTGQITDIHIWGSWYEDLLPDDDPRNVVFTLSFHNNNPQGPQGWSEPNELLWRCDFGPGQFTVEQVPAHAEEAFYCPCVLDAFFPNNHMQVWKYSFYLDDAACEQFTQEGSIDDPSIYWLDVQAQPLTLNHNPQVRFGWKTSIEHWKDDAVWARGTEDGHSGWTALTDPRTGETLDMAFAITTMAPGEIEIKWSQPPEPYTPEAYNGWNELSVYNGTQITADDWRCDTDEPVTDIHWWGSYQGWACEGEPPIMPESFHIAIWTDVPLGAPPADFSHPNEVIWEIDCDNFTWKFVGWDIDPRDPFAPPEACFKFEQDLLEEEWFHQKPGGNIYWISIAANYPTGTDVQYPFGCKTRPRSANSRAPDDAVKIYNPTAPMLGMSYGAGEPIYWPTWDDSWDLAFVLTTREKEPKPPVPHLKWSQPPIEIDPSSRIPVYSGWDEISYIDQIDTTRDPLVADDYRCLGSMPVTSIHWWGSHYGLVEPGTTPPVLPIGWKIGFWSNVPEGAVADYSYPEKMLWQVKVPANRVEVEEVGTDFYHDFYPEDIAYQYTLYLEPNEFFWQADFLDDTQDDIFWLSIAAIYPPDIADFPHPWGWKTRPWSWMDDAVRFTYGGSLEPGIVLDPIDITPIKDPIYNESFDVAFELDTDPNYIKWEQPFTGIRHWPHYEDEKSMARVVTTTEVVTKWLQNPDLTDMGVDVDATLDLMGNYPQQLLADDYKCDTTDAITGINIYGSWWFDQLPGYDAPDPGMVDFTLSFHDDIPVEHSPTGYSMPGDVIWWWPFNPGEFSVDLVPPPVAPESYYMPCSNIFTFHDHQNVWKYSFSIPESEAFVQQGTEDEPVIYWLDVQATPLTQNPEARFGWKTSMDHWNDDATWVIGMEPYNGDWNELRYPLDHPYGGESIDLAFELTTQRTNTEFVIDRLVADDWKCERRTPVTATVWWGSYIGYAYKPCHGQVMTPPVKPDYFLLNIWTDVPANADSTIPFSHPNEIIWEYKAYDYDEVLVGFDKHPHGGASADASCATCGVEKDPATIAQIRTDVLSAAVVVPAGLQNTNMGTEEPVIFTGHELSISESAAVSGSCDSILYAPSQPDDPNFRTTVSLACGGATVDYFDARVGTPSVSLLSTYDCVMTWANYGYNDNIQFGDNLADYVDAGGKVILGQWCLPTAGNYLDGRIMTSAYCPVTASTYSSGSYNGDGTDCVHDGVTAYSTTHLDIVTLNIGNMSDGTFDDANNTLAVAWRPDRRVYYSPGNMGLYPGNTGDWPQLTCNMCCCSIAREPVFRYSVRLPRTAWFFQEDVNDIYWFSVVAVYKDPLSTNYPWGWTNHSHVFNDDAVAGHFDPPGGWFWTELRDQIGNSEDMSFMLFTDPDPTLGTCWDLAECAGQPSGDATCNGLVNLGDLMALKAAWGQTPPWTPPFCCADFNHDNQQNQNIYGQPG